MNFPDKFNLKIVSDAYLHYDLGYYEDIGHVVAYCDHCDECVAAFPYADVEDKSHHEMYEMIIDKHRKRSGKLGTL